MAGKEVLRGIFCHAVPHWTRCFKGYLLGIERAGDDECPYSGEGDTPEHVTMVCRENERVRWNSAVGVVMNVEQMMINERGWRVVTGYLRSIISRKESDERQIVLRE